MPHVLFQGASPRRRLATLFFLMALFVSAAGHAGTVLVVGDSISAGYGMSATRVWVKLLEARMATAGYRHTLLNASLHYDTTVDGLARLPALLRQHKPVIVVIQLGRNDSLRSLSIKVTRQNLLQMAKISKKTGALVLLIDAGSPKKFGAKYAQQFRAIYPAVAKATGAKFLPAFLAAVARDPDLMQADGAHPNGLAQPLLVDRIWPVIQPMLKATR